MNPSAVRDHVEIAVEDSPTAMQRQSQEALHQLAHDLRQPLSTIETCAFYLRLIVAEDAELVHQYLRTIEDQVERANNLILQSVGPVHAASR